MKPRVVIIGGGFGGLNAAKALATADTDVVLVDRTNYHLFQPLLYQIATAALSPAEIAVPLRSILKKQENLRVVLGEVRSIDKEEKLVTLHDKHLIPFDYLIVAPGSRHSYFGRSEWEQFAPGLKDIEDAVKIREKILISFEVAEIEGDPSRQRELMTFVIVGGGPTGVELAGAIAEIAFQSLPGEFRNIDTRKARIILVERANRLLPAYPAKLSRKAYESLQQLGVEVCVECQVTELSSQGAQIGTEWVRTPNIIWAAGNEASPLLKTLAVPLDRAGRVLVEPDLSIPGRSNIFVIGDAAHLENERGELLPGLAAVATQQGQYVGNVIRRHIPRDKREPFRYKDYGLMATIGRAKAVARIWRIEFSGFIAWMLWSLVHIRYLIGFRNKFVVMLEWIWAYVSYRRHARLITKSEKRSR